MKHILKLTIILFLLSGCQLAEVENPQVSNDKFINSPQAAASWINGVRRQLALTTNQVIEFTELVSDNYFNNRTLSSKVFDIPEIPFIDIDVNRIQASFHALRTAAEYGLEEVLPFDERATAEDEAILRFYKGIAYLYNGVYFTGLPAETLGEVFPWEQHLQIAIQEFDQAIALTGNADLELAATLAKARAHYRLGDQNSAVSSAQQVINGSNQLNYQVRFDGNNGVNNQFQFYLFDSSNDEFAPLPRLDFLDPKFYSVSNPSQEQKPVSLFKAEEAYLIVAEAQIADNQLDEAKTTLKNLLSEVIANRPLATFDDSRETRSGGNRTDYPLSAEVMVKFSPDAPAQEGFILDRQAGPVTVPTVSGTSVTADQIDAAATADALLEILYLMRQEIFIAEGQRMADLGIKFPIAETEVLNNPNSTDAFTTAQIPDFIPRNFGMDDFAYDEANNMVTMAFNMNRVIVENKNSAFVAPFE